MYHSIEIRKRDSPANMKNNDGNYKIGELASMFGLTVRTVRYYEELVSLSPAIEVKGCTGLS